MSLRRRTAVSFTLGALVLAAPAGAQITTPPPSEPPPPTQAPPPPPPPEKRIADGVTAAGVDLGGMTIDEAAAELDRVVRPKVERPIRVVSGRKRFRLPVAEVKFAFDNLRTAKRAYVKGKRDGPGVKVKLATRHSAKLVREWTESIDRRMSRKPRNATVRMTTTRMFVRKGKWGRTINEHELARAVSKTLRDPARKRRMRAKLNPDRPSITHVRLRSIYRTVVTVDKRTLHLRLFKRLRHRKTYRIALGMAGFDTPRGRFTIQSKQVNPTWHVPNRSWAGSLAGSTVPGGAPNNPLKARWLGVSGSVGIHGTAEEWSIGTRASRGCIRMRVSDVIDLYRRVPFGSTVLIR